MSCFVEVAAEPERVAGYSPLVSVPRAAHKALPALVVEIMKCVARYMRIVTNDLGSLVVVVAHHNIYLVKHEEAARQPGIGIRAGELRSRCIAINDMAMRAPGAFEDREPVKW